MSAARAVAIGTLIAGALDIGFAAIDAALGGRSVAGMLRSVANGPFPSAREWGLPGAALGLAVHFAIMAAMVTVFVLAHRRIAWVRRYALGAALLYGVALWLVMYGIVLPLRFGAPFPSPQPIEIAKQLFAHVVLVGLTIGLATRALAPAPAAR